MLDFFAERAGDVEARIALRANDLSSQWSYLELAQFCLAQGRKSEALARAEEGLWLFEDERLDERLADFAAQLMRETGRGADAEALLWRVFDKAPSLDNYRKLRSQAGARERAIAFLEQRLGRDKAHSWQSSADLLVEVLIEEEMFDQAWRTVKRHGASLMSAEALSRASEQSHPKEALDVYAQRVEQLAASSGGYEDAARIIARMSKLRGIGEQAAYVTGLKDTHRRKRIFMKLLG